MQLWRELGGERRDIRLLPEALAMLARYPWPGKRRQLLLGLLRWRWWDDRGAHSGRSAAVHRGAGAAPENADTGPEALQAAIDRAGGNQAGRLRSAFRAARCTASREGRKAVAEHFSIGVAIRPGCASLLLNPPVPAG
ncbi:hypothetical protein M8494_11250 [Serratia ureilytica]